MALFKKIAQDPDEGPGKTKDCETCSGTGKITNTIENAAEGSKTWKLDCPWCNGTGKRHV